MPLRIVIERDLDARRDHAKQHLYHPFVLWAGQMLCCSSNLLNRLEFERPLVQTHRLYAQPASAMVVTGAIR
jgi:hypothetical protein